MIYGLVREWVSLLYSSVEEAYQAAKFIDVAPEIEEQIKQSFSAHEAQKIAFANRDKQRSDWNDVKLHPKMLIGAGELIEMVRIIWENSG